MRLVKKYQTGNQFLVDNNIQLPTYNLLANYNMPTLDSNIDLSKKYGLNPQIRLNIDANLGRPYGYGSRGKTGAIDCSGFMNQIFLGTSYDVRGNSVTQWNNLLNRSNDYRDAKVGDLIFLQGTNAERGLGTPSHVAVVTGIDDIKNGKIRVAEASSSKGTVERDWDMNGSYYPSLFLGVGTPNII